MNVFCFVGRIGKDAEVRHTTAGHAVASFSAAINVGFGERKSTLWVRCNLWGKRAEGGLIQYLVKGAQVAVSGELNQREYEAGGETRTSLEVKVSEISLVGGKQSPTQSSPSQKAQDPQEFNDDIPF